MTSADGQNYNEDAVAEITLKMGNASQVIYKVTRAKENMPTSLSAMKQAIYMTGRTR